MNSSGLVLCIFAATATVHILIHRILFFFRTKSLVSLLVFAVGFLLIPATVYPYSSRVLYVLLSLLAGILYLTPFLGGETPASMILSALRGKKRMSEKEILDLFSDEGLIEKRIQDLAASGLLVKDGNFFFLSLRGRISMHFILLYQKIFNRVLTG